MLGLNHFAQNGLFAFGRKCDRCVFAFHPLLQETAFLHIGDVHIFKADRTAIIGAQRGDQFLERVGGNYNATTYLDRTNYYAEIGNEHLEGYIAIEADRMRNLNLTEEDVTTERQVILEERNERTDSDPGALLGEQMAGLKTEVLDLDGDVLEVVEEANRYIVSVRFTGSLREDGEVTSVDEIWHLTKPRQGAGGWVLAGIQQTS